MTKNEATDLHIAWMDGYYCGARMKRASIAQSIRDAAINEPHFLGDVECEILNAFEPWFDCGLRPIDINKRRTFMLLVAEALE